MHQTSQTWLPLWRRLPHGNIWAYSVISPSASSWSRCLKKKTTALEGLNEWGDLLLESVLVAFLSSRISSGSKLVHDQNLASLKRWAANFSISPQLPFSCLTFCLTFSHFRSIVDSWKIRSRIRARQISRCSWLKNIYSATAEFLQPLVSPLDLPSSTAVVSAGSAVLSRQSRVMHMQSFHQEVKWQHAWAAGFQNKLQEVCILEWWTIKRALTLWGVWHRVESQLAFQVKVMYAWKRKTNSLTVGASSPPILRGASWRAAVALGTARAPNIFVT